MKKRVFVAMSGGVDSSVAAALLINQGYEVIGMTMRLFPALDGSSESVGAMDAARSVEDARTIAEELQIPHHVLDLESEFSNSVIDYFLEEYRSGRTPNPCIRCNRFLKFGALLERAGALGADSVATGHYARIELDEGAGEHLLRKAVDEAKDQSYFLYILTQEHLARVLMPLGVHRKEEVRGIARRLGLHVHERPESQEICFIEGKDYRTFFKRVDAKFLKPGSIRDSSGRELGRHNGIAGYTIGQRRGLGISHHEPLYVTRIDRQSNTVYVGTREEVYHRQLLAHEVNWVSRHPPGEPLEVEVKIRSIHTPAGAQLHPGRNGRVRVDFHEPQWAVTPGQAAVFYSGDRVLGGGTILEGIRDHADLR
jgi:tRNA-specific 2-thiouridylase